MTQPHAPVSVPHQERSGTSVRPSMARWWLAGSALALAACSSTPLPPWPAPGTTPPSTRPSTPAPVVTPTEPSTSITPVAPSTRLQGMPYSAAIAALFPDPSDAYTTPGLSDGRTTATSNAELNELLQNLAQSSHDGVRLAVLSSGSAQSGAPLQALVATKATATTPLALDESRRPNVLIVAGQHGTDVAATEATLVLAKELAAGGSLSALLDRINLIVVPRANPDGFERGQAATADGTDLRTDHLTLRTPEARFLAKLTRDYRPAVVVDAGEFAAVEPTLQRFAAVRANDVGLQYGLSPNSHEFITKAAREWLHQPTSTALAQAGLRVDWAAEPSGADAAAGFAMGTLEPTTLRNTASLKNTVSMEVLSRGSDLQRLHLQRRVHSHVQSLHAVLRSAALRADELRQVHSFVTRDIASKACQSTLAVQAAPRAEQRDLALIDAATAQITPRSVAWASSLGVPAPRTRSHACGYWLSPNAVQATERLNMLGVIVQRVGELSSLQTETYRAAAAPTATDASPHTPAVSLQPGKLDAAPGSYYVSMNQPLAYLAAAALEPDTPYSFISTGVLRELGEVARVTAVPSIVFDEE